MEHGQISNEIQKLRLSPNRPFYSENRDGINTGEGTRVNIAAGSNKGRERER